MLTTPDFVEDSERDLVHSIAPGQHSTPLSIFKDQDSEELTLVNIFCGQKHYDNMKRLVSIHYSDVAKSELRRSDRGVAYYVENTFFKPKKGSNETPNGQGPNYTKKM